MYDFAKEMHFDVKAAGKKSTPDRSLITILKLPSKMVYASGSSKTKFFPSDPNKLSDRIKFLLQEK